MFATRLVLLSHTHQSEEGAEFTPPSLKYVFWALLLQQAYSVMHLFWCDTWSTDLLVRLQWRTGNSGLAVDTQEMQSLGFAGKASTPEITFLKTLNDVIALLTHQLF